MNELPGSMEQLTDEARGRRAAFLEAIPQELQDREDNLPGVLRDVKAAPRAKLQRIYAVIDEISLVRKNFVACGKGCSDCCRINISVTKLEAARVAKASGRTPINLRQSIAHLANEFYGQPCPFLVHEQCSIYQDRPFACRSHASYYTTSIACKTDGEEVQIAPMVNFSGLEEALYMVSGLDGDPIVADIRDFFPRS